MKHYKGTMICGFCPSNGFAPLKSFNCIDTFKQHLRNAHSVAQNPPNTRKTYALGDSDKMISRRAPDATGKCSICNVVVSNAQYFYEHLDECVMKKILQDLWQKDFSMIEWISQEDRYPFDGRTPKTNTSIGQHGVEDESMRSNRKRKHGTGNATYPAGRTATICQLPPLQLPELNRWPDNTNLAGRYFGGSTMFVNKAKEALQTLHSQGSVVNKSLPDSPKRWNVPSVRGQTPRNLVTCEVCNRFTGRPSDLRYLVGS